jgi:site-specific DNA-methyltransferase (adenine-specific)
VSERWGTPPEIKEQILAEFKVDLDAAGDAELHIVENYLTDALNGKPWPGKIIFCNPPYGRKLAPFVREMHRQATEYGAMVLGLIPFRCRAAWWHDCVIGRADEVRCFRKRIKFVRPDGTRGKFTGSCDSCLVIWGGHGQDVNTRLGRF